MSQSQIHHVRIDVTVVLGRCVLPMRQFLRMGRGAVIPLDVSEHDEVWILANGHPIARGEVSIDGERVAVMITGPADRFEYLAQGA